MPRPPSPAAAIQIEPDRLVLVVLDDDAEDLLKPDDEFEKGDGVDAVVVDERGVGGELLRGDLEEEALNDHFLDAGFDFSDVHGG